MEDCGGHTDMISQKCLLNKHFECTPTDVFGRFKCGCVCHKTVGE